MCSRFIQTFGNVNCILCLYFFGCTLSVIVSVYGVLVKIQLCYYLNDTLSQVVHLAIIACLDCGHFNRFRCIKLDVLIVKKEWRIKQVYNLTKTASSCGLHFPLFRTRWYCSTWTHGKHCWKPRKSKLQKSKIISVLDIIKDMGKEEITSVQYRHKFHRIFTFKKMLKAIKTFSTRNWARHALHVFCTRSRKYLEGPKYETAFSTVFRAACRWTDLKGSKHLDLSMLAIIIKEPFIAEVHHYRSCYHAYTLWVRSVTSWVVNLKHCMRQQKDNPTQNSLQPSETNSCQIHKYC